MLWATKAAARQQKKHGCSRGARSRARSRAAPRASLCLSLQVSPVRKLYSVYGTHVQFIYLGVEVLLRELHRNISRVYIPKHRQKVQDRQGLGHIWVTVYCEEDVQRRATEASICLSMG